MEPSAWPPTCLPAEQSPRASIHSPGCWWPRSNDPAEAEPRSAADAVPSWGLVDSDERALAQHTPWHLPRSVTSLPPSPCPGAGLSSAAWECLHFPENTVPQYLSTWSEIKASKWKGGWDCFHLLCPRALSILDAAQLRPAAPAPLCWEQPALQGLPAVSGAGTHTTQKYKVLCA